MGCGASRKLAVAGLADESAIVCSFNDSTPLIPHNMARLVRLRDLLDQAGASADLGVFHGQWGKEAQCHDGILWEYVHYLMDVTEGVMGFQKLESLLVMSLKDAITAMAVVEMWHARVRFVAAVVLDDVVRELVLWATAPVPTYWSWCSACNWASGPAELRTLYMKTLQTEQATNVLMEVVNHYTAYVATPVLIQFQDVLLRMLRLVQRNSVGPPIYCSPELEHLIARYGRSQQRPLFFGIASCDLIALGIKPAVHLPEAPALQYPIQSHEQAVTTIYFMDSHQPNLVITWRSGVKELIQRICAATASRTDCNYVTRVDTILLGSTTVLLVIQLGLDPRHFAAYSYHSLAEYNASCTLEYEHRDTELEQCVSQLCTVNNYKEVPDHGFQILAEFIAPSKCKPLTQGLSGTRAATVLQDICVGINKFGGNDIDQQTIDTVNQVIMNEYLELCRVRVQRYRQCVVCTQPQLNIFQQLRDDLLAELAYVNNEYNALYSVFDWNVVAKAARNLLTIQLDSWDKMLRYIIATLIVMRRARCDADSAVWLVQAFQECSDAGFVHYQLLSNILQCKLELPTAVTKVSNRHYVSVSYKLKNHDQERIYIDLKHFDVMIRCEQQLRSVINVERYIDFMIKGQQHYSCLPEARTANIYLSDGYTGGAMVQNNIYDISINTTHQVNFNQRMQPIIAGLIQNGLQVLHLRGHGERLELVLEQLSGKHFKAVRYDAHYLHALKYRQTRSCIIPYNGYCIHITRTRPVHYNDMLSLYLQSLQQSGASQKRQATRSALRKSAIGSQLGASNRLSASQKVAALLGYPVQAQSPTTATEEPSSGEVDLSASQIIHRHRMEEIHKVLSSGQSE